MIDNIRIVKTNYGATSTVRVSGSIFTKCYPHLREAAEEAAESGMIAKEMPGLILYEGDGYDCEPLRCDVEKLIVCGFRAVTT